MIYLEKDWCSRITEAGSYRHGTDYVETESGNLWTDSLAQIAELT